MVRIGKIVATHGLQGAVILTHIIESSEWLKPEDVLFLEMQRESYIPFFLTSVKVSGDDEYVISFEDVTAIEEARKLIGRQVFVKEDLLSAQAQDSPLLWIGFNLVDKEKGALGKIGDVFQTGHQWLAKLNYEGREVLIPLIDEFILDINIRNKFIRMDLPEGLLTL